MESESVTEPALPTPPAVLLAVTQPDGAGGGNVTDGPGKTGRASEYLPENIIHILGPVVMAGMSSNCSKPPTDVIIC